MECRKLGNTQLTVSIVGFGTSPLGNAFRVTDPAEGKRAIHLAIREGINFFDTSPLYGVTLAEERLGSALVGKRQDIVLMTKCGRYGEAEFDFSAKRITASVDESLKRLRTDYVDILLAHDVEFGDLGQIITEAIPAMRLLQKQGKTRFIGVSAYPLKTLVRIAESTPLDIILTYCRYNLLINDADRILMPVAEKHGIGVVNASPLHMGMLTVQGAPDWHPAPQKVRDAAKQAAALCRRHGLDLSALALRFCFDYSRVATTMVGMTTCKHVEDNLQTLSAKPDPAIMQQVRSILAPVFNYVWPEGRPENQD